MNRRQLIDDAREAARSLVDVERYTEGQKWKFLLFDRPGPRWAAFLEGLEVKRDRAEAEFAGALGRLEDAGMGRRAWALERKVNDKVIRETRRARNKAAGSAGVN